MGRIQFTVEQLPDITVDVNKQSLGELIQRPKVGSANSVQTTDTISSGTTTQVASITGKGMILDAILRVLSGVDSQKVAPQIMMDGNYITPGFTYKNYNDVGFGASTPHYVLSAYGIDSECVVMFVPHTQFTFENTLKIKYNNTSGTDHSADTRLTYALI